MVCLQHFAGTTYIYHCGPLEFYDRTAATGFWNTAVLYKNHDFRACVWGAVPVGATGVAAAIIKFSAGGFVGFIVGAGFGCISGIMARHYWN